MVDSISINVKIKQYCYFELPMLISFYMTSTDSMESITKIFSTSFCDVHLK